VTDVGIYGSRQRLLEIAEQIRKTFESIEGSTDTVVYAISNNSDREVVITFSNEDSEPGDGGYLDNNVVVDIVDFS
jgi:hypothetical protein